MTSKPFIVLLVTVVMLALSSCDKYEKQQKFLHGTWELTSYRFKNQQGLSYYPESSGSIFFENCESDVCAYSMSIDYSSPQITGTRMEAGKYSLNVEDGTLYFTPIENGIEQEQISNFMSVLTRTDLKFQYTDDLGRSHYFVFEK